MKNACLFLGLVLLLQCQKDNVVPTVVREEGDFVFAEYGCFCTGDRCFSGFLLRGAEMLQARGNRCEPGSVRLQAIFADQDDLQLAHELLHALPAQLLHSEHQEYGCPNCTDAPAYFVEIKQDGLVRTWRIDGNASALPPEVAQFQQQLRQTLQELQ